MDSVSISDKVLACLDAFNSVSTYGTLPEELARFKVWAGNIGAHRKGSSSLDYRLRDASHLRNQAISLLGDLEEALVDAKSIIDGDQIPWDENESDRETSTNILGADDVEFDSELSQIHADVAEIVTCLYQLSVSMRNPAPYDRLKVANQAIDTTVFEAFDTQHVQSKYPNIALEVASRLGKANSRRRQYFRYRESHHQKLAHGLDANSGKTEAGAVSTIASSIPKAMKDAARVNTFEELDEDAQSIGGFTHTSFATSASGRVKLSVPPLPEASKDGPFECPFCFMMISANSTLSWRKHVFADLRPYTCLEPNCPTGSQQFPRRREWMEHVIQNHWRTWECTICVKASFHSAKDYKSHLEQQHDALSESWELCDLLEKGEHWKPLDSTAECPLCDELLPNAKAYRRHVGRHQEEVALFSLPSIETNDQPEDAEGTISGLSSAQNSDRSQSIMDQDAEGLDLQGHEAAQPTLVAPHISPAGASNTMLLAPTSMVDEGLDEFTTDPLDMGGSDFMLFPPKPAEFDGSLFMNATPSAADGFTHPSSQDFNKEFNQTVDRTTDSPVFASDSMGIRESIGEQRLAHSDNKVVESADDGYDEGNPEVSSPYWSATLSGEEEQIDPENVFHWFTGLDIDLKGPIDYNWSDVMAPPPLRPEPPQPGVISPVEGNQNSQATSYWSVSEATDFPHLLSSFGSDWSKIAAHMGTKTPVMVENYYLRKTEDGNKEWEQRVTDANSKKLRGKHLPIPPPPTPAVKMGRLGINPLVSNTATEEAPVPNFKQPEAFKNLWHEPKAHRPAGVTDVGPDETGRVASQSGEALRERANEETTFRKQLLEYAMPEREERIKDQRRDEEDFGTVVQHDKSEMGARDSGSLSESFTRYLRKPKEWLHKSPLRREDSLAPNEELDQRPTYTRMARRHVSLETLRVCEVDYQLDADPNYVLIKRLVTEAEQDMLWRHTRLIREARAPTSSTHEDGKTTTHKQDLSTQTGRGRTLTAHGGPHKPRNNSPASMSPVDDRQPRPAPSSLYEEIEHDLRHAVDGMPPGSDQVNRI